MEAHRALLRKWPGEFARVVEMMTGSTVRAVRNSAPSAASLWWENRVTTDAPVRLLVGASKTCWFRLGSAVLKAAGVEATNESEVRATWLELLRQTAASTGVIGGPETVIDTNGGDVVSNRPTMQSEALAFEFDGEVYAVELMLDDVAPVQERITGRMPSAGKTMDALLDVHLPVSISFGHARIPLKDVLRITAGTVVELNRQPEDPVDVIVNDCVIARGEVVVVDGNYAVRIQTIVGRQERLGLGAPCRDTGRISA